MRPNQHNNQHNKRSRGRGRRHPGGGGSGGGGGGGNPANRVYESNGPDIKVRGTAQTIADKYLQLGRDAHSAGDNVMAESYYQHAEHYLRIVAAAQAYQQQMQQQYRQDGDEDDDGDDLADGGDGEESAESPREQPQPQPRIADVGEQPDIIGFDGGDRPREQPPQRQEREFRPRNEGRERFRPQRFDRNPGGSDSQQRPPRHAEPQFQAEPAEPPVPAAVESVEPPRPAEPVASNGNPFGDGEQPSFLRRGAVARPKPERRPRRERNEEAVEAPQTPAAEPAPE